MHQILPISESLLFKEHSCLWERKRENSYLMLLTIMHGAVVYFGLCGMALIMNEETESQKCHMSYPQSPSWGRAGV
jgi:hypothetical protein